jgi:LmbE family N-acetylglucosaminyl deacetylase
MEQTPPVVLGVSPHPDDELLGAPALLMALRDAGWRVVNLACSLGRPADRARRARELTEACRRAEFELLLAEGLPEIGVGEDLALARSALTRVVSTAVREQRARVIVGPSPHDGHHGHEVVGRAICDAVEADSSSVTVLLWGLWADLPFPTMVVWFDRDRLTEIEDALAAHTGELARNRFDRLLAGRAAANAVLGPERVFGFGVRGHADAGVPGGKPGDEGFAELLTEVKFDPSRGWRLGAPRTFNGSADADSLLRPFAPRPGGRESDAIDWWIRAPSLRDIYLGTRA